MQLQIIHSLIRKLVMINCQYMLHQKREKAKVKSTISISSIDEEVHMVVSILEFCLSCHITCLSWFEFVKLREDNDGHGLIIYKFEASTSRI